MKISDCILDQDTSVCSQTWEQNHKKPTGNLEFQYKSLKKKSKITAYTHGFVFSLNHHIILQHFYNNMQIKPRDLNKNKLKKKAAAQSGQNKLLQKQVSRNLLNT